MKKDEVNQEKPEMISVIVKQDAMTDAVRLGNVKVTKKEAVEVPASCLDNPRLKKHLDIL